MPVRDAGRVQFGGHQGEDWWEVSMDETMTDKTRVIVLMLYLLGLFIYGMWDVVFDKIKYYMKNSLKSLPRSPLKIIISVSDEEFMFFFLFEFFFILQ
jgi:hypothetical protein